MTSTGHALIGTAIAVKIGNPALAIPLALVSHFVADAIPHWDTGFSRRENGKKKFAMESSIDLLLGFILSFLFVYLFFPTTSYWYVFLIIIVSQLPDWLTAPYLFMDIKTRPFNWFYKFQKIFDNEMDKPWGVINQIIVVCVVLMLAIIL